MSTALAQMSLESFLAWERAQKLAYEFDGFAPVPMTGGSLHHRRVADDLARALNDRLASRGCEALPGDVKVVAAGRVRYPDVVATCAPQDDTADIVRDPVLLVEVASPSTVRTDNVRKLEEYRHIPSVQYYLVLVQEAPEGVLFTRDGDFWRAEPVTAPGDLRLPTLGLSFPLAEAYRRVTPAPPEPTQPPVPPQA